MHRITSALVLVSAGCMLTDAQMGRPLVTTVCSPVNPTPRRDCYGRHCGPSNYWPADASSKCRVTTAAPNLKSPVMPEFVACQPWPECAGELDFSGADRARHTLETYGNLTPRDEEEEGEEKAMNDFVTTIPASTVDGTTIPAITIPASTIEASTVPATVVSISTVAATTIILTTGPAVTISLTTAPTTTAWTTMGRKGKPEPTLAALDPTDCDCSSFTKAREMGCDWFCAQTYDDPSLWHYERSEPEEANKTIDPEHGGKKEAGEEQEERKKPSRHHCERKEFWCKLGYLVRFKFHKVQDNCGFCDKYKSVSNSE